MPAAGDLKHKGGSSQPDGGAAAPAPHWPRELRAPWTVVTPKADDTEGTSPPPPPTPAEQAAKWADFMKHFCKGAGERLFWSLPPVALGRQIYHNLQVTRAAASHAWEGDWDLAGAAILEMPQQNAEALVGIVTGPIEAAMDIPDGVSTAIDSQANPEMRGEATVATVQAFVTVVATVVGAAAGAKAIASGKLHGNNLNTTKPAEGYTLRDATTGKILKYGETTLGTRRYSKPYLKKVNAELKFEAKGTKRQMHDWQNRKIREYKAQNGGKRPPLNKSDF